MKIKLTKGLSFNKEVLSKLNDDQLTHIKGGRSGCSNGCSCCEDSCDSDDAIMMAL